MQHSLEKKKKEKDQADCNVVYHHNGLNISTIHTRTDYSTMYSKADAACLAGHLNSTLSLLIFLATWAKIPPKRRNSYTHTHTTDLQTLFTKWCPIWKQYLGAAGMKKKKLSKRVFILAFDLNPKILLRLLL